MVLDVGLLTDSLLSHVTARIASLVVSTPRPLVGDGVAPAGGGWLEGQPGQGVFRPYAVVASAGVSPVYQNLSSFDPDWNASFSLRSFGGSRKQCDWMANLSRLAIAGFVPKSVGSFSVIGLQWGGLGPTSRVDATEPPFWQVFDSFSLVLSS
jgi:hypothetical protein